MSSRAKFISINLVGLVLAVIVMLSNPQIIQLKLLSQDVSLGSGMFFLAAYLIGLLIGSAAMFPLIAGKQEQNVAKLKEWQEQDAKLAIEVQSDKEKQLEAKIATLEAALKQALKK